MYSLLPTNDYKGGLISKSWPLAGGELSAEVFSGCAETALRTYLSPLQEPVYVPIRANLRGLALNLQRNEDVFHATIAEVFVRKGVGNDDGFDKFYPYVDPPGYFQVDNALPGPGCRKKKRCTTSSTPSAPMSMSALAIARWANTHGATSAMRSRAWIAGVPTCRCANRLATGRRISAFRVCRARPGRASCSTICTTTVLHRWSNTSAWPPIIRCCSISAPGVRYLVSHRSDAQDQGRVGQTYIGKPFDHHRSAAGQGVQSQNLNVFSVSYTISCFERGAMNKLFATLSLALLLAAPAGYAGDVVLIGNGNVPKIDAETAVRLYTGRAIQVAGSTSRR